MLWYTAIEGLTRHSLLDKPQPLREPTPRVEIGSYFLHCSCLLRTVELTGNIFPAGVRATVDIDVCTCMYQLSHCGAFAADILQQILINVPPPNLLSPTISHLLHHSKYTLNCQTGVWINKTNNTEIEFVPHNNQRNTAVLVGRQCEATYCTQRRCDRVKRS